MKAVEQNKLFKHIRGVVDKLRSEKPAQYQTKDNVFTTYEQIANKKNIAPGVVLNVLAGKHEVSIELLRAKMIQGEYIDIKVLDEKFGDLINYTEQYYTMLIAKNAKNKPNDTNKTTSTRK